MHPELNAQQRGRCMGGCLMVGAWWIWAALLLVLSGCGGGASTGAGDTPDGRARALAAHLDVVTAGPPDAVESLYSEAGKLVRADDNVAALGSDLFGDRVNLYNGTLEFVQTDVSLPGNSALPVSVGRRLVTGQSQLLRGHFGDWDLEIPRLHGVFAQSMGWKVGSGVASASSLRCTNFGPPPQALGTSNQGTFNPVEYWHGSFLYMPGAGSQELLRPSTAASSVNPTGPLASPLPKATTKDRWLIYCGTQMQNGGGEGFVAVAPDGTRYRFDWMVSRPYAQISKPYATPPQRADRATTKAPMPGQEPNLYAAGYLLKRVEVWIMPTEVRDRYDNVVTYAYDSGQPWRLSSIQSRERSGALRKISFEYQDDAINSNLVRRVTDGTRSWIYNYTELRMTGVLQGKVLSSVNLPTGGGTWDFNVAAISTPGPMSQGGGGTCDAWPEHSLGVGTGEMTHPSGAKGIFRMAPVQHARSHVPRACMGNDWDGTGWNYYPLYIDAYSIQSKTLGGPGLPPVNAQLDEPGGYTWKYSYGASNASFSDCTTCPVTKTVTVTDPQSVKTLYTFGNAFRENEGQLLTVEEGYASDTRRLTTHTYARPTDGPYPDPIGDTVQARTAGDLSARYTPEKKRTINQQAVDFIWEATRFDALARPVDVWRHSSMGYSRRERVVFADEGDSRFKDRWILGQVKARLVLNEQTGQYEETESHEFDAITLNRSASKSFGLPTASFQYTPASDGWPRGDGTLWKRTDGRGNVTRFENYKLGLAQDVFYADGAAEHADVNDLGLVTAVRNAAGTTTGYHYDDAGRLDRITPPNEPNLIYHVTELRFERVATPDVGLDAGHWRQIVTTGNARTERHFDALWRPVLSRSWDTAKEAETSHTVLKRFDGAHRLTFESYPKRNADIPSVNATPEGTRRIYDQLNRLTQVEQDSELGTLVTKTQYLDGFRRRTTNPRQKVSDAWFQAFDAPSEDAPVQLKLPEGVIVDIGRDSFGRTNFITRGDASRSVTRRYVYDAQHRLCKTIEPEVGSTVLEYDMASNLLWRAPGVALPDTQNCNREIAPEASKIVFEYDSRNRLISTNFRDGSPGIGRNYTPDGLLAEIWSNNALWTYTYNQRRLLVQEEQSYGRTSGYKIGWGVDAYGHVSSASYPDGATVQHFPNALGLPTWMPGYASNIKFHPNGALASYDLDNGVRYSLTQNIRGLPRQWQHGAVVKDKYAYDENGNVTNIEDELDGRANRSMGYDGLDRLKTANGVWGIGSYDYDAVDNITASRVGDRVLTHRIDPVTNQLTGFSGTQNLSIRYDPRGNVIDRGGQAYVFDLANRLVKVPGKTDFYSYDGHGRRVGVSYVDGSWKHQVYGRGGKLMFAKHSSEGDTRYIYLGDRLLAEVNTQSGIKFVHTDALGSPVAKTRTDGQVIAGESAKYEPYGAAVAGTNVPRGVGFTGHVNDADTELVYMQQRYYDPIAGRFISVDPVATDGTNGTNFGRYHYANNNPFGFIDPAGMEPAPPEVPKTARQKTDDRDAESCARAVAWGGECYGSGAGNKLGEKAKGPASPTPPTAVPIAPVAAAKTAKNATGVLAWLSRLLGASALPATAPLVLTGDTPRERNVFHYTTQAGYEGISGDGYIAASKDGNVYVTPDLYFNSGDAQSRLALSNAPVGYFVIPWSDILPAGTTGRVAPANGQPGEGTEIKVPHTVPVKNATWVRFWQ